MKYNRIKCFQNCQKFVTRNCKRIDQIQKLTQTNRYKKVERIIKQYQKRIYKILIIDPPFSDSNPDKTFSPPFYRIPDLQHKSSKYRCNQNSKHQIIGTEVNFRCEVINPPRKNHLPPRQDNRYHIGDHQPQIHPISLSFDHFVHLPKIKAPRVGYQNNEFDQ